LLGFDDPKRRHDWLEGFLSLQNLCAGANAKIPAAFVGDGISKGSQPLSFDEQVPLMETDDQDLALSDEATSCVEPVGNRFFVPVAEIYNQVLDSVNRETRLRRVFVCNGCAEPRKRVLISLGPAPERIFGCLPQFRLC